MGAKSALIITFLVSIVRTNAADCKCKSSKYCDLVDTTHKPKDEVYVFSRESTQIEMWKMDTISTIVAPSSFDAANKKQFETMCTSHKQKKRFGITVNFTLHGKLNSTSKKANDWKRETINRWKEWHADVLVVDFMPYFLNDIESTKNDHLEAVRILKSIKHDMDEDSQGVELTCIVPWKPPCAATEASCDFSTWSKDACDFFIINPDSFSDQDDVKCRARATIPFSKLVFGISEYASNYIPLSRIIIGVPWHGYEYQCKDIITQGEDICILPEVKDNNTKKCDFGQRKFFTYKDLLQDYATEVKNAKNHLLYTAPHFTIKKGDSESSQIWFEDYKSLLAKYRLVNELSMRGVAIMYGDDLGGTFSPFVSINERGMWSWVGHEFVFKKSKELKSNPLRMADTVAGVAVGCLLLGVALGTVFTCIALRRKVKKPKPPFYVDVNEYTDEDPNL